MRYESLADNPAHKLEFIEISEDWLREWNKLLWNCQVDEYYAALTGTDRKKRGGPYVLTPEETHYLNGWMALTHVGADAFEDGTGHMHLFDLLGEYT